MRRPRTAIAIAISSLAGSTLALPAHAQPVDPPANDDRQAEAEKLFEQGKVSLAKEDWTSACALFDASAKIIEAVPALVKVARCAAHEGKRAKAIDIYERALAKQPWPELERLVRAELFEMQQETPSIHVTLVEPASGVTLRRNGQPLTPEAYRERLWTDVGTAEHLEAEAPGYHPATFDVTAKTDGEVIDVRIALTADAKPSAPPGPHAPAPPRTDVRRPIAWTFVGSGALGVALGAAFGVEYLVRRGNLFDDCTATLSNGTHVCPAATSDHVDAAVDARTRTAVMFGVGAALATTGVVLLVTAPKSSDDKPRTARSDREKRETRDGTMWIGAGPGSLQLGGAF